MKGKTYSVLLLDAIIKLLLNRLVLQTGASNDLLDLRSYRSSYALAARGDVDCD